MMVVKRGKGRRRTTILGLVSLALFLTPWTVFPQADDTCKADIIKLRGDTSAADSAGDLLAVRLCVRQSDSARRKERLDLLAPEALRLASLYFDVPEYHDEGRLPATREQPGVALGPLAGIYASPFLQGFTRPAQIYEQGDPGTLVGFVIVQPKPEETLPISYTRLNLKPGMNCVWLNVDPPATDVSSSAPDYLNKLTYHASISHAPEGSPCDRKAEKQSLAVVAVSFEKYSGQSDYPPVARFLADVDGWPILGFRCLKAFCEIGVSQPSKVRTPDNLKRPDQAKAQWRPHSEIWDAEGRKEVIKGWHDEQLLAIRDAGWNWKATDVKAWIRPNPEAESWDSATFESGWKTVGTIELRGEPAPGSKYASWGLHKGNNDLQFHYDAAHHVWQAQLVSPTGATHDWKTVERIVHQDVTVPATVRFRWTFGDDGVWAPCGNACCNASGNGT